MGKIQPKPWTKQEEELLRKMPDAPVSRVASLMESRRKSMSLGFSTPRSASAIRHKRTAMVEEGEVKPKEKSFAKNLQVIREIQKQHYSGIARGQSNYRPDGRRIKILSLSDIHFPFARVDVLEDAINEHKDAQALVLNGDIIEGYAFSSFDKSRLVYAIEEYRCLFDLVQTCLKIFPQIHLVEGNHEDRIARYLNRQGVGSAQSSLLKPSVMQRIANGEELDKEGNTVALHPEFRKRVQFRQKEPWWTLVGKTLFIHPSNKISADPGFTAVRWDKVFSHRFPLGTYDALVSGHTHCVYQGVVNGRLLVEQGCLSGFMDYEFDRRQPSLMKAMNGYAVIYQDEQGNTDFNRSRAVYCGYVAPPDPVAQ